MLKFGNKEFRNLQEQVYKNMQDISSIKAGTMVIDEFGIKVVGEETSIANMPTVEDYKENNPDWEYGDAYAIGEEAPYELYVLTRANGTHPDDYWFNIGEFPAPGPQGEEGPQGEQGVQGQTGPSGADGVSAGFGTVSATATTLLPSQDATVSVTTSGPNTAMNIAFAFGIPQGEPGAGSTAEWGSITGDLDDQTDLVNALQAKQNASNAVTTDGTQTITGNKTLTGSTSFGSSGAISISGSGISVYSPATIRTYGADLNLSGSLILGSSKIKSGSSDSYGLLIPTTTSYTANKTLATTDQIPSLTGYATETWVTNQGYLTSVSWSDVSSKPTFATVATSGSYTDLTDKPSIPTVSGTNDGTNWTSITINSDTYDIPSGTGTVTDVTLGGTSVVTAGVAALPSYPIVPTNLSSFINDVGFITSSALSGYAELAGGTSSSSPQEFTGYNKFNHTIVVDNYVKVTGANSGSAAEYTQLAGSGWIDKKISGTVYTIGIPSANGTLALTSDIPSLTGYATETWVGNQGYAVAANLATVATSGDYDDLLNKPSIPSSADFVTLAGDQTITGTKTFDSNVLPSGNYQKNLGNGSHHWSNVYVTKLINSGTYGVAIPDSSSWTANKTLATTDDIPSVPVTDVTVGGTSVVSSGTAVIPAVPTSASTTVSASSESFTFTYADGTTTTKTFLTAITSATTTLS